MAMVANFLQTSVQKFKARLHHFHASAADVSFFCTIGSITLLVCIHFPTLMSLVNAGSVGFCQKNTKINSNNRSKV